MQLAPIMFACLYTLMLSTVVQADTILFDFNDPTSKSLNWTQEYKDNPELSIQAENTTSNNFQLNMRLKGGDWPGFSLPVPQNWRPFEVFRFEAFSAGPVSLTVRIDDPGSKDYNSRFHHTFKLKSGRNLCQIEVKNIAEKLDVKQIRAAILFCNKPPKGLVVRMDNFVLGAMQGETVPFIPYNKRKDLQPQSTIVTPHFSLAKPLAGGPLHTFFLTSVAHGREVVEMTQRMDIKQRVQHWDKSYDINTWGMGDFYGKRGHKTDYVLMQEYLASSMQGPEAFDSMMLFTPQGWARFGKSSQDAILKRVKQDGVGLVFVFPYPGEENGTWPDNLREINALVDSESDYPISSGYVRPARNGIVKGKAWRIVADHPITRGVPLNALPFERMQYQRYKVAPGAKVLITSENGDPILAVKNVGKGRVATIAWRSNGLTPNIRRGHGEGPVRPYRYWEVIYSLLNRANAWVAKRNLSPTGTKSTLRDEYELNLSADVYKNKQGEVTDWSLNFQPPGKETVKTLNVTAPKFISAGSSINVKIQNQALLAMWNQQHPNAVATVSLKEVTLGRTRTLLEKTMPLESFLKGPSVSFTTEKVTQLMAVSHVEIRKNKILIGIGKAETVVTPNGPAWDDYEILMWHNNGLPFMREREDALVTQLGSTGIMETRWQDDGLRRRYARAGLRFMVHDLAREQLQLRSFTNNSQMYNKTGDKKLLIRNPSFADSTFLTKERARIKNAVLELKKYHPTNYILCDEPSLTYYRFAFDYDFHPENITRFKTALKKKFGTIQALNKSLGTAYKNIRDVYPVTTQQARKNNQWPLWNEWRIHNDNIMAQGYSMYKEAVTSVDPKGTISLSGTQVATPFDGFDWSKLSPHFGTMQGYGYGHQEQKRLSFANGSMINAVPAGYGRSGRAVDYQIWNSITNHGGGHVLFWWIAFRNPDLTFCQSAYDYMKIFNEMKSGIGRQFLLAKRELSPVAVQYSMNSMRAAFAFGGDYHKASDQVTSDLISLGYDPLYLSDDQIANGALIKRGIKAVYMPASYSLDSRLPGALKAFIKHGGNVFYNDVTKVNEYMRPIKGNALPFATPLSTVEATKNALLNIVKPAVSLSGNSNQVLKQLGVKVHTLQGHKDARLVTILRPPVGTKEVLGGDGVIHVVPDKSGGNALESIVVDLGELNPKHIYAPRTEKKITLKGTRLPLTMQAGDGTPLALLPYAVNEVKVSSRKTRTHDIAISWQLTGSDNYAHHVVRISVMENGKEDPILSANATTSLKGKGTHTIRLAKEDQGRTLSILVRDVLTGVTSTPLTSKL